MICRRSRQLAAALAAVLLLGGCAAPATAPLPVLSYPRLEGERQPHLLVLLRGLGAGNLAFAEEGIIAEIRARHLPFDVVAPDSHFGYYAERNLDLRLKEDVIDPARRQGYQQIWLAGFSLGGLGSLLYLRQYPGDIDGVLLTSPFLGWPPLHRQIRRAGGLAAWQPAAGEKEEWEVLLWDWIREQAGDPATVPIYLGYGSFDLLAGGGPPLLATVLPPERVFRVFGNHTIGTFKTIFGKHLDTLGHRFGRAARP